MDYLQKIKDQDIEFSELDKRMQQDSDLLYLSKYVMLDKSGKHAVPDIINATLNKPAVLFSNVVSSLGSVKQQVTVEAESQKIDTTAIEEAIDACFSMANVRLRQQKRSMLNPHADIQFCARGRTGRRILVRQDPVTGKIIMDLSPLDGRYIRYGLGEYGIEDGWYSYSVPRTKADIEKEYGIVVSNPTAIVRDVWDDKHNEVWLEDRIIRERPHDYGFTPVVLGSVSLGYGDALLDTNHIKNEGESIFFLMRDVIPQLNMILSILQTLNFMSIKAPQQYASSEGAQATPPEYDEAVTPGAVTSVDKDGGFKRLDFGDATNAAQMAYTIIEKAIQEGGYTDIDIGNVQQPFSAIALITIGESKDQVYLPRLAAKEYLNRDTAEMIIRQLLQIGGTVELGIQGHKRKFNTSKFEGEYTIEYKYFVKSPKVDVARMAIAQQAEKWYPRTYIWSEVLQVEDPKKMEDDWYAQQAEILDPNVMKHRTIMNLLDKAEREDDENAAREAMILAAGMGLTIEQIKAGIMAKQPGMGGSQPGSLPPLLASDQGGNLRTANPGQSPELLMPPQPLAMTSGV